MYLITKDYNGNLYAVLKTYEAGYESERDKIKELNMNIGDKYIVDYIDVYGYHTDVFLIDFPDNIFNSVFFDFYDQNGNEVDVYELN